MSADDRRITQFTDKYEYTNPITKKLISGFFKAITGLCPSNLDSVFEVGSGAGYSTVILKNHIKPKHFHASDIDPLLVDLTKEKVPDVTAGVESIYQLPHPDNSFDLIFALEVFEHLEHPEQALAELARVTKRYVIISVPREPIWRMLNMVRGKYLKDLGNTPGHLNHWSTRQMAKFIGTKFKVIAIKTPLPWTVILAEKRG